MTDFLLMWLVVGVYALLVASECLASPGTWRAYVLPWLSAAALIGQGYLLYGLIDGPLGQNLAATNLLALIAWLAAVMVFCGQWTIPIASLGLFVYPIAALSLVGAMLNHQHVIVATVHQPVFLFHILLSTVVVGVFVMGGCQALLLALQEYLLRHKKFIGLLARLPPLQWMEVALFTVIKVGVVALSLLLLSSLWLFKQGAVPVMWSKILLTFGIWWVFVGLLAGRHFLGWRGNTAVMWTTIGVLLAVMVYLGSHFLLSL